MNYTAEVELKDFLEEYMRSRFDIEESVKAKIYKLVSYENQYQKYFYDFSKEEVLNIYRETNTISVKYLQNFNMIAKYFARWAKDKKGSEISNVYDEITKADLIPCVNKDKKRSMILSREQLIDIQNELLNWTDKAILELLFLGVGGQWLKELCYLERTQVSLNNMCIYFKTGKVVPLDERAYVILEKSLREMELVSYNSTDPVIVRKVKNLGIYKMNANVKDTYSDSNNPSNAEHRYRWCQKRFMTIRKYLDINMTPTSIQESGLLHCIKLEMQKENMTFNNFITTQNCKKIARRYDIYSDLYPQILKAKFEQYV